jgi:hypothetical protein
MSCKSPFEYKSFVEYEGQRRIFNFEGGTSINGYKTPYLEGCLYYWVPPVTGGCKDEVCTSVPFKCKWKGCKGGGKTCVCYNWISWKAGYTEKCCCWTTPSVTVIPDLNMKYNISIPMDFSVEVGIVIDAKGPQDGKPYVAQNIEFNDFVCDLIVNGRTISIPVPCKTKTSLRTDGEFSTTFPIASVKHRESEGGLEYDALLTFNLLMCLAPEAGVGWLNIQVIANIEVDYKSLRYGVNGTALCPIIKPGP